MLRDHDIANLRGGWALMVTIACFVFGSQFSANGHVIATAVGIIGLVVIALSAAQASLLTVVEPKVTTALGRTANKLGSVLSIGVGVLLVVEEPGVGSYVLGAFIVVVAVLNILLPQRDLENS